MGDTAGRFFEIVTMAVAPRTVRGELAGNSLGRYLSRHEYNCYVLDRVSYIYQLHTGSFPKSGLVLEQWGRHRPQEIDQREKRAARLLLRGQCMCDVCERANMEMEFVYPERVFPLKARQDKIADKQN